METQIGYERLFDPQDIFFSTTDTKGVIKNTNTTFDVLSRYSRDRLVGSPHNIIRHQDMPGGVFRLMWDDLLANKPVCAYVINRAADNLDYRVFATIVPLHDGFLSVRCRPMDTATQSAVEDIYRRVRGKERSLANQGASRRQVAEFGARELTSELEALGMTSLYDLTLVSLPREVAALVRQGVRVPAAAGAHGPVPRVLSTAATIERDTNALVFQLDEYLRLLGTMEQAQGTLNDVTGRIRRIETLVSHDVASFSRSRSQSLATQITELAGSAGVGLKGLPRRLQAMRSAVLQLRFSVALMRLLPLMVGRFAASTLNGSEQGAVQSLTDLCEALDTGFAGLAPVVRSVRNQAAELDDVIRGVTSSLDRCARRLGQWVDLGGATTGRAALEEVTALTQQGFPEVRTLSRLAAECRSTDLPYSEEVIVQRLNVIRSALAELQGVR